MSGTLRVVPGLSPSSVAVIQAPPNSQGQVVRLSAIDQIAPRDYISTCLFFRHSPDVDKEQIFLALHRALLVTVNDIPELTCCVQKRVDSSREEVELVFDSARGVEIYYKDYNSAQLCGLWTYGNFDQLEEEHFPHSKIPRSLVFGPSSKLKDNVKLPSLIVQASFIPGGLIIGSQLHHVAGDGQCNFMLWSTIGSHFAAATCEPSSQLRSPVQLLDRHDIVKGDLNTTLEELPHWKLAEGNDKFLNPTEYDSDEVFESAIYFIPADKIALLKTRILSTMPSTTKAGTVTALCAFLWRHIVLARGIDCLKYPDAKLAITVDARTRMESPVIPSTYWGNFAEPNAVAQLSVASLQEGSVLSPLSSQPCESTIYARAALNVQRAIAAVDDKAVRRLVGLLNQMPKSTTLTWNANRYPGPDMLIVCIQHHGYNDINFGEDIGYPLATRVTVGDTEDKPDGRCLILPPRRADSRGLEISLQGESEHDVAYSAEKSDLWNICAIFTSADFSWARSDLPLSYRAWVFQERLLSPRTLHFGSDRISWECDRSRNLTEYLPDGVGDDRWNGFDCSAQNAFSVHERGDLSTWYYDLVFPYTNRKLSHPDQDKLVAFAAVARRCIPWFGSDYCAGIFRSTMPQGLLWGMSPFGRLGRSSVYRAPSWSWASLDCRVRFNILDDGEGTVLADIADVAVELVDPNNRFGQLKSASLILTGPLVAFEALVLKDADDREFVVEDRSWLDGYQDMQTMLGHTFGINADTVDLWVTDAKGKRKHWLMDQKNMYLLAVLETSKEPHTHGLLLQKNDNGTFTKAGIWEAGLGFVSKHADTTCQFTTEMITVI
ncbi:trichothecene 3-o-acetyltransferase [Fusarium pseudocircinatum]|uniref:Trichothecene 3-o-acetyltransferase n=1 Tax=Fusarium pseudocircinatum TaxID=56676 RepID=A0A8H5L4M7_9HYPO|nr:trichothecene 3-o-acetyltransferase [Fusarium pseudocircinatum]